MSDPNKSSLRIDWFDGTLIEDSRSNTTASSSAFADEEPAEPPPPVKPQYTEKKPIGFKRLLDISLMQPPLLNLEVAHRAGFWHLLDNELKGDFIVLIVKVLANIYKSIEPGEKSRISNLLKTKLETSIFVDNLKEYLKDLPQVRVVEKRMNAQLWDDVQSFYANVVSMCEGILDFGGHSDVFLNSIYELLEITETSAVGVREEHMETFSNELFIKIQQMQSKILNLNKDNGKSNIISEPTEEDVNSYKNLDIFPSRDDLLSTSNVQLQPNIINGAYPSVKHYLDLQFKLLREDCFAPLRDGICKYLENPTKRRYENIRVFPKVRILRTYISNNQVGHLVDIAWKERINHGLVDSKKYAHNKQLMFGSLLLFTSDNFDTILCATVLDSSMSLLADGYVAVSFQNPVSSRIFTEPYLMVESEVFFEPYHRVLKVLQSFKENDLPMKRYIVDVQAGTQPPTYLNSETLYSIIDAKNNEEIPFPVRDEKQWPPSECFGLDDSQMEAYKFALTREFAVIQGPPGTGKTFIGVKIASSLLRNLSLEGTPMLIICYTNHALDQFLEGVLNVTKNIVRLGGQSKNKNLDAYTLHNLRGKVKSKYSYLYGSKRSELEKIFKEMTELQTEIEKCEREILSYKTLKPHLKIGDKLYELKSSNEDPVLSWLFDDVNGDSKTDDDDDGLEDWEKQLDDLDVSSDKKIETCFSVEIALKEIDSMMNSIKYVRDITDDHFEGQKMTDRFEAQINKVRKRLNCFKRYMLLGQDNKQEVIKLGKVTDLYGLTMDQRWSVYYSAVKSIKNELTVQMTSLLERHNTCSRELNEVSTLIDGEVMRTVRVVGVTTTTAARRHDLMRRLLSPIVIVEEAAEVLEAHIVASLTHHCQHLILIGDHKQLRPTAAHYRLAKHFNLEISLFERMVRNGVHARCLAVQRRMRPQCAGLLVPIVYEELRSHPSVEAYPDVRGVAGNLYFCTHDVLEDSEGLEDSWSHKNTLEAKWCVALADYLRLMEYRAAEITILATYTGQATLIKEFSRKYDSLRDVKITVVDNYQGEENRIVILSLVRSNRDGRIGFLAAPNRICVALSRAKEGFYIFGNMNVLKSASNVWRSINEKLTAQNAIGNKFPLRCHIHGENTVQLSSPDDFDAALSDTCLRICQRKQNVL